MKGLFRSLVLGLSLCSFGAAQAGPSLPRCPSGQLECEYVLTYGWVCYCV